MKKFLSLGVLSLMIATGVMAAEDYSFEPVEISAPKEPITTKAPVTNTTTPTSLDSVQADGFQNALLQLDSAQVDMRDRLLEYKNQYSEIDAQYTKYKTERANMKKTIKQVEKRIKNIDKYKKNIRKDMM